MRSLPGLAQWGARGFWAVLDQGTFAASNFLLNVLLARWLTPQEYGAFAVAFSAFLFLAALHVALLIEPMLVFGAGRHRTVFRRYLRVLLAGHGAVSIAMVGMLGGVGLVAWRLEEVALAGSFVALALACPFILFQWLMRRSCYARLNPRPSALAGIGYLVAVLGGAVVLFRADQLSAVLAIALMGVASLAAGAFIALTYREADTEAPPDGFARSVLREHWRYGRWAVASGVLLWAQTNLLFFVLPLRWGLEATAALRALANLAQPALQAYDALSTVLLPALVSARDHGRLAFLVRGAALGLAACGLTYYLVVAVYRVPVMAWLYAGQYDAHAWLVPIASLLVLTASVTAVFGTALRALEMPAKVFWAYLMGFGVTVVASAASLAFGVAGGAVGLVAASLTAGAMMAWYLWRVRA